MILSEVFHKFNPPKLSKKKRLASSGPATIRICASLGVCASRTGLFRREWWTPNNPPMMGLFHGRRMKLLWLWYGASETVCDGCDRPGDSVPLRLLFGQGDQVRCLLRDLKALLSLPNPNATADAHVRSPWFSKKWVPFQQCCHWRPGGQMMSRTWVR